jgi:S-adenosylmethionine synthetase
MRPYFIEQRLKLRNPIYSETAAYGYGTYARNSNKTFSAPGGLTKTVSRVIYMGEIRFCDQVKTALV